MVPGHLAERYLALVYGGFRRAKVFQVSSKKVSEEFYTFQRLKWLLREPKWKKQGVSRDFQVKNFRSQETMNLPLGTY